MMANSVSLGMIQSLTAASSGSMAAPGAGLRMVVAPRARAASKPAVVTDWSISNWPMTASTRSMSLTAAAGLLRSQPGVGTGHDDDAVAAIALDPDGRDAAGAGCPDDVCGVNPVAREVGQDLLAVAVVADRVDHGHLGSHQARHDRLVGTLAAEALLEAHPHDGLAAFRQAIRVGDLIDHGAADHGQRWTAAVRACRHGSLLRLWDRVEQPLVAIRVGANPRTGAATTLSAGRGEQTGDVDRAQRITLGCWRTSVERGGGVGIAECAGNGAADGQTGSQRADEDITGTVALGPFDRVSRRSRPTQARRQPRPANPR